MILKRKKINKLIIYIVAVIVILVSIFPTAWMISTALKKPEDIFTTPPQLIPKEPVLRNFIEVFESKLFLIYYRNSLIVSSATVILCLTIASLAGYSFSRFKYKGSTIFQLFVLVAQMFPLVLLLISIYVLFSNLRILNTLYALILADCTFALPFSIWMLKGFFDTVPKELEEAARIDGCSRVGILTKIIMPLILPGIVATSIYVFLLSWDEFLFALTLTSGSQMRTLPVGIVLTYLGEFQYQWGNMMAASFSVSLPVTILFILLQKYLIRGLTAGAVKG